MACDIVAFAAILKPCIVLGWAKDPADPTTLNKPKTKKPWRAFKFLDDPMQVLKSAVLSIFTEKLFGPIHNVLANNHHANLPRVVGGFGEITELQNRLRNSVKTFIGPKGHVIREPCVVFWKKALDIAKTVLEDTPQGDFATHCRKFILDKVDLAVRLIGERFKQLWRLDVMLCAVCDQKFVPMIVEQAWISVPTHRAIVNARKALHIWGSMNSQEKHLQGRLVNMLFDDNGCLRLQLIEFSKGLENAITGYPQPLRRYSDLHIFMARYFALRLGCFANNEVAFSSASHIVHSGKCHITTQSLSLRVRLARNCKAFHYPSQVLFKEIDPTWKCGDLALPGSIFGTSELHPKHVSKDIKIESSIQDLEMHGETAQELLRYMQSTEFYKAKFLEAWEVDHGSGLRAQHSLEIRNDDDGDETQESFVPVGVSQVAMDGHTYISEGENTITVTVWDKLPTCPPQSTVHTWEEHHCSAKDGFTFFRKLSVIDDLGDMHSLDVNDNKRLALLNYLESEETKILAFSDIISIYTPPGSNKPWVEHGYFWEEEDLQNTPEGEIFLKTVHLEDQELVNGYGVFHTPAECIEGIVWCYEGKKEYEAVTESLPLANEERKDHFFWQTDWDPTTGRGVEKAKV